jgi:non-specific serine/threonine protein kinase
VTLFADRAALSQPGFAVTEANAAAVVQICQRLDGMPLAIELAAARLRVMAVEQLAARLDDRFRLLTGGSRTALPRQQTLQATMDWSYDLLSEAERALLRRLSVFAGGFTLEAAEAVCAPGATRAVSLRQTGNVLDQLLGLVEKSLVGYEPQRGEARYRLLETVRQYAWEQLTASGELPAARDRHRDWCLQLAEQADAAARGPEQTARLNRLAAELDNLRAALAWCRETANDKPDSECASASPGAEAWLRLASALYWLWIHFGYLTEGSEWLEGALVRGARVPASVRSRAFVRAAYLARLRGRLETFASYFQSARQGYEDALKLACTEGDQSGTAGAIVALAEVTLEIRDIDAAWDYGIEARQRMAELGDRVGLVRSLEVLSALAPGRGEPQAARSLMEERLALCRELGTSDFLIHALGAMGHLERDKGNYGRAQAYYQESLVMRRELGNKFALAQSLEDLAVLAGRQGQAERAIRLLGAAEAFCETLGTRLPVAQPAVYQATVAAGRAALGEAEFAALWAEGQALSLEEAIDFALETSEA